MSAPEPTHLRSAIARELTGAGRPGLVARVHQAGGPLTEAVTAQAGQCECLADLERQVRLLTVAVRQQNESREIPGGLPRPGDIPGYLNVSATTYKRLRRKLPKLRIPIEHPNGTTTYLTRFDPNELRAWWQQFSTARLLAESRQRGVPRQR